jgi:hypothetical protein
MTNYQEILPTRRRMAGGESLRLGIIAPIAFLMFVEAPAGSAWNAHLPTALAGMARIADLSKFSGRHRRCRLTAPAAKIVTTSPG